MPRVIGSRIAKDNARELVTGRATYTADMRLPGLLFARTKRADHARAKVSRINVDRARAVRGIVAVLTAADIPGDKRMGILTVDQCLLVTDRVHSRGDNIALVIAENKPALDEAVDLIEVDYEPLPPVLDPYRALIDGSVLVHDDGNLTYSCHLLKGEPAEALQKCDVTVEGTYSTPFQQHAYLEPEAALAVPEAGGRITIYVGCQGVYRVRSTVARALGRPESSVRVVQKTTGGSFGGKPDVNAEMGALAAVAAVKLGRPVLINHSREEVSIGSSVRHAATVYHKTGATRDGRILFREIDAIFDGGAYASLSPFVAVKALAHSAGPYNVPNIRSRVRVAYTNKTYAGACRGFGVPQVIFAAERQMDELALRLGMDPAELRRLNAVEVGAKTATNQQLSIGVGLRETLERATTAVGWPVRRATESGSRYRRGVGVACMMQGISLGAEGVDAMAASCHLSVDGSVVIGTGVMDMGQGTNTSFAQLAAETLGVPVDWVKVRSVDTDHTPNCGATVASRGTTVGGRAVLMAARSAREAVLEMASKLLDAQPEDLEMRDGQVFIRDLPKKAIPLAKAVSALYWSGRPIKFEAWSKAPDAEVDKDTHQGDYYIAFGYGTHVMEVEVDLETGQVAIVRHVAAHDVGRAINPLAVEGQIEGGSLMGLGLGMMEEIQYDADGRMLNPNFTDYLIPTAADSPDTESIIVEDPGDWGPEGAKGVGEFPVSAAAAALAGAVSNALGGIPLRKLPITPDYVLELLSKHASK